MGWIRQAYAHNRRTLENSLFAGVVTGKPVDKDFHYGGLRGRLPATGYGLARALEKIMELKGIDKNEVNRVAVSGFGNVGSHFARLAQAGGYKIVGLSDSSGAIYSQDGFETQAVLEFKNQGQTISQYSQGKKCNKTIHQFE